MNWKGGWFREDDPKPVQKFKVYVFDAPHDTWWLYAIDLCLRDAMVTAQNELTSWWGVQVLPA